ncbi:unnamed protein product [Owenia fusiformis]|uniref:Uncharacterized protein n=1 Tax=Owenia fusiformis TaxID=6347 RepID=A0A8J1XUF4_OWEFU|nr:unnamed protein product [Owenia fusiformis]
MSLVAYDSSGDSGSSDEDESPHDGAVEKNVNGKSRPTAASANDIVDLPDARVQTVTDIEDKQETVIYDEDIWEPVIQDTTRSSGLNLPAPKVADKPASSVKDSGNSIESQKGNGLGLPLPQKASKNVTVTEDEGELEDLVKPKPSQLADVPKPPPKKIGKKIQIVIPELPDAGSSDEEDEPEAKKYKPSTKKTGLFALLPDPKHSAFKKETKRPLIPHTLTKKPTETAASKAEAMAKKKAAMLQHAKSKPSVDIPTPIVANVDSDNEEDNDNSGNFFSLGDKPDSATNTESTMPQSSLMSLRGINTVPTIQPMDNDNNEITTQNAEIDTGKITIENDAMNAPLAFKSGAISPGYSSARSYPQQHTGQVDTQYNQQFYNQPYEDMSGDSGATYTPPEDEIRKLTADQEFLKMQGKKQRGEAINIIDINADDHIGEAHIELTKGVSEEQGQSFGKKKQDDGLSGQTKRKHQITWLAAQAKERELELKNSWAANRQTKRQTQSKYGF